MVARMVLVCVGIGLLTSLAVAQNTGANAPATNGDLEAFAMRIEAKLSQWQKETDDRLTKLEEKVQTLSDGQESGRQALAQIAKRDNDGNSFLRIDASHEPTRRELRNAIEAVAPEIGTVIIHNKTNSTQAVDINGRTYDVIADSKRPVEVPYRHFDVRTSNNRSLRWGFNYPKRIAFVDIVYAPPLATSTSVPTYLTYVRQ